jgi:hypothetical protein
MSTRKYRNVFDSVRVCGTPRRSAGWVSIKTTACVVTAAMSLAAGVTLAKLPAPTPEQAQAAAAKKQVDQLALEKEKILLQKAQDRVADAYKRTKTGATATDAGRGKTESINISRKAVEPSGTAGPRGGKEQSAEAHSTPAK